MQDAVTICTLGIGTAFGESILDNTPRHATIVSRETSELLRIEQREFKSLWEVRPQRVWGSLSAAALHEALGYELEPHHSAPTVSTLCLKVSFMGTFPINYTPHTSFICNWAFCHKRAVHHNRILCSTYWTHTSPNEKRGRGEKSCLCAIHASVCLCAVVNVLFSELVQTLFPQPVH